MPIVVINPAFGRSMTKWIQENPPIKGSDIQIQCTCLGSNPGNNPGSNPGSNSRSNPGSNLGSNPGSYLWSNLGSNPGSNPGSNSGNNAERYFQSLDYNAGRHATSNSAHKFNCLLWRPTNSSHLHSWRRGWTQN